MTRLSRILHPRWTGGERPRQFEARLDSELRFHFDEQVAANLRKGMSEAEARRATRSNSAASNRSRKNAATPAGFLFSTWQFRM